MPTTLFQAVQRFYQFENLTGFKTKRRITESRVHVDFFIVGKFFIEICTLDINLIEFHVKLGCYNKNSANKCQLCHESHYVKVIDTGNL